MTRSDLSLPPSGFPLSRRRFLRGSVVAAGGLLLGGPAVLAACGSEESDGELTIRWSNWPAYVDPPDDLEDGETTSLQDFTAATGIAVTYNEDIQDNETYFAKIREPLSRGQDIGSDVFIISDPLVARLNNLGWLREFNYDNMPNVKAHLAEPYRDSLADPGRRFSIPYFGGFVSVAYNRSLVSRPVTKIADLFEPDFAGQVTMFNTAEEAIGMVLLSLGYSPATVTVEQFQEAADVIAEAKAKNQFRAFTGNDYMADLEAGNIGVAQCYSGDVAQIRVNNEDVEFVVPEEGMQGFMDCWCMPASISDEAAEAVERLIDFYFDPVNNAKLTNWVQYISPVDGVGDELMKIDPEVANNPLINPPAETLEKVAYWRVLTEEEDAEFAQIYASVVEGS